MRNVLKNKNGVLVVRVRWLGVCSILVIIIKGVYVIIIRVSVIIIREFCL